MTAFVPYGRLLASPEFAAHVEAYGDVVAPGRPHATALMHAVWMGAFAEMSSAVAEDEAVYVGRTAGMFYAAGHPDEHVERDPATAMPWTYMVYANSRGHTVEFREMVGLRKFTVYYDSERDPELNQWEQDLLARSYWRILQDPL